MAREIRAHLGHHVHTIWAIAFLFGTCTNTNASATSISFHTFSDFSILSHTFSHFILSSSTLFYLIRPSSTFFNLPLLLFCLLLPSSTSSTFFNLPLPSATFFNLLPPSSNFSTRLATKSRDGGSLGVLPGPRGTSPLESVASPVEKVEER